MGDDVLDLETNLTPKQYMIAERSLKEINNRLTFLVNVGLDYLSLDRSAGTLSGGEAQRIRSGDPGRITFDGCALCPG